jgi:predicted  nucleic acid-binding Zn-ribbon protein
VAKAYTGRFAISNTACNLKAIHMKAFVFSLALGIILSLPTFAQTADEILSHGMSVKKGEKIILKIEPSTNKLLFDVSRAQTASTLDFIPYQDKSYFLVHRSTVNVYIVPINPLNQTVSAEANSRIDQINANAEAALNSIASQINSVAGNQAPNPSAKPTKSSNNSSEKQLSVEKECKADFKTFTTRIDEITKKLNNTQKEQIKAAFNGLKKLSFETKTDTWDDLQVIKDSIDQIKKHYEALDDTIKIANDQLDSFKCADNQLYATVGRSVLATIQTGVAAQRKRLAVLTEMYDLVNKAYKKAANNNENMMTWLIKLGSIDIANGKITDYVVKINKEGYELSSADEIQAGKSTNLGTYTISARRYDWFIPEVDAAVVYTDVEYPKYGTTTNASGQMVVANAGNDKVSKFAVSTMLNFHLYFPNSSIRPFIQVGAGASTDYPALFSGAGIKISNRFSISVGYTSPWIKELKTLKVDSPVSGTAELEKDIERNLKPFRNLYAGLQIKL